MKIEEELRNCFVLLSQKGKLKFCNLIERGNNLRDGVNAEFSDAGAL